MGPAPEHYGDPSAEHLAVRRSAGLVDRSARGRIAVLGGDREEFLQGLLSNDVKRLAAGHGAEALLLQPKGKLIADMVAYRFADHFLLDCPAEARADLARRLDMYTLSSDVRIEDRTESMTLLSLHGPRAVDVLRSAAGAEPPADLLAVTTATLAGAATLVSRVDWLGETGFDMHLSASVAEGAANALVAAGAVLVGTLAAESLRIEAGRARYGAELDGNTLPPEVPDLVARAVSYTKGCFVGQETLARVKNYGHVNRELRRLEIDSPVAPEPGAELRADGNPVGRITSSCVVPGLPRARALGYVARQWLAAATRLETTVCGRAVAATVL